MGESLWVTCLAGRDTYCIDYIGPRKPGCEMIDNQEEK